MQCSHCTHQTARPVLYDASLVNQMISDIDRIDLTNVGSQTPHALTDDADNAEIDINGDCKCEGGGGIMQLLVYN